MNLSETPPRVISIGEDDSPARRLAYNRTFRERRPLSLLPKLQECGRALATSSDPWIKGNRRFLSETFIGLRPVLRSYSKDVMPVLADGALLGYPRTFEIAASLVSTSLAGLSFEEIALSIEEYQSVHVLQMKELWALDTMLVIAILDALAKASPDDAPRLITSLKAVRSASWQDFFEANSRTEKILREDPAGFYRRMDFATRDRYRHAVETFARDSNTAEEAVARAAIDLSRAANPARERHVGFHLIDRGADHLKAGLEYRPDWRTRVRDAVLRWPTTTYLVGIEFVTLALAAWLLSWLPEHLGYLGLIVFLLATEPAIAFANAMVTNVLPPRSLPKLDFSDGIPADCLTMAVVPTLLLSEKFVTKLLRDLEVRYLGNRDPNLCFALLTDFPDATNPTDELDHLAEQCAAGVRLLNDRYGTDELQPFYLFHRRLEWNPKQSTWMGLERKRGKLIALNNLLRGEDDAFSIKTGDLSVLPRIRFVITLDSDTEMPRGSAQKLAGTLAHPLNRAVIDPATNTVVEGYGILQPRVGISIESARKSRLASLYSGLTGYDLYSTAISDVYQDLFGEGSYVGKGIYDVEVFQKTLAHRFPHDMLLSHDLIEGTYARAGLASDIELIDDYPSHYSAWSKRKHRWTRGDWQIMLWLLPRVPDYKGNLSPNPLSVISLWKIVDNLRRSLMEIAVIVLLIAGWTVLPGGPRYWTAVVVAVTVMPVWIGTGFSVLRLPFDENWRLHVEDTARGFISGHVEAAFRLIFLPHQACIMLDAILRSVVRTTVTGRRLLEWESAAQAEMGARKRSHIERLLWLSPPIAIATALAVLYVNRPGILPAIPLLIAWALSPLIALWLNAPLITREERLSEADREFLLGIASRTWAFFTAFATAEHNWLAPDNVREEDGLLARRASPTNIGLLLNAHLAAADFGFITRREMVDNVARVFGAMRRMERVRGHFLNWYDTAALAALAPRYVSTVDSGNLAASLIALRQGLLEMKDEEGARDLARQAGQWVAEMDFGFLLKPKRKLFHIGWNADTNQFDDFEYDLLASESRTASFIAIAKNDVPHTHWARLGRRVIRAAGGPVLLSWSGTMFEYLMPSLWFRQYPDTLLSQTACGAVRCQEQYGQAQQLPWGISECAAALKVEGGDHLYFAFGVPELAANPEQPKPWAVAPYAAILALCVEPRRAIRNLREQVKRGWLGPYGFYESADFSSGTNKETLVRVYMAHHHGMSLVALDNLLNDSPMRNRFHREPMIEATALLLHEREARRASGRQSEEVGAGPTQKMLRSETSLYDLAS